VAERTVSRPGAEAAHGPPRRPGERSSPKKSGTSGSIGLLHVPTAHWRVLPFNVTEPHRHLDWRAQQVVHTFPDDSAPSLSPARSRRHLRSRVPAPSEEHADPWNAHPHPTARAESFAELLIGSIRRECLIMFHHFPGEEGIGQDCLVRSMAFDHRETQALSFVHRCYPEFPQTQARRWLSHTLPAQAGIRLQRSGRRQRDQRGRSRRYREPAARRRQRRPSLGRCRRGRPVRSAYPAGWGVVLQAERIATQPPRGGDDLAAPLRAAGNARRSTGCTAPCRPAPRIPRSGGRRPGRPGRVPAAAFRLLRTDGGGPTGSPSGPSASFPICPRWMPICGLSSHGRRTPRRLDRGGTRPHLVPVARRGWLWRGAPRHVAGE
jgi:hypothetical protein